MIIEKSKLLKELRNVHQLNCISREESQLLLTKIVQLEQSMMEEMGLASASVLQQRCAQGMGLM